MKNITLTIAILALMLFSCNKQESPTPTPITVVNPPTGGYTIITPPSDYWGCWKPVNQPVGTYDIILTEQLTQPHGFEFGVGCVAVPTIPAMYVGVFRNDTLILDNGIYEYWCYIENDTLNYNAYTPTPQPSVKFIQ